VYDRVLQIKSSAPGIPWFLIPGGETWTLPFLAIRHFDCRLAPERSTIGDWEKRNPGKSAYVLVLQGPYQNELSGDLLNAYANGELILKLPAYVLSFLATRRNCFTMRN
jgi:hypothetical protein